MGLHLYLWVEGLIVPLGSSLFFFFFGIGNKTFIEKTEHHVHDGEHSEQGTNTTKSEELDSMLSV